jgi:hypothetical protein
MRAEKIYGYFYFLPQRRDVTAVFISLESVVLDNNCALKVLCKKEMQQGKAGRQVRKISKFRAIYDIQIPSHYSATSAQMVALKRIAKGEITIPDL